MKRLLLTLLPIVLVAGSALATVTATTAAPLACVGHGYSAGNCASVGPGRLISLSVPGVSSSLLTLGFTNTTGVELDVEATTTSTPPGAPAGSQCFSAQVYNHASGAVISGTLSSPIIFNTSGTIYSYNSSTGGFSTVSTGSSGHPEAYSGGIYCLSFASTTTSSTGIGLPSTGGAADRSH